MRRRYHIDTRRLKSLLRRHGAQPAGALSHAHGFTPFSQLEALVHELAHVACHDATRSLAQVTYEGVERMVHEFPSLEARNANEVAASAASFLVMKQVCPYGDLRGLIKFSMLRNLNGVTAIGEWPGMASPESKSSALTLFSHLVRARSPDRPSARVLSYLNANSVLIPRNP